MTPRLEVAFASNAFGIGGAQRAMATQALAMNPARVRARALAVREDGARSAARESADLWAYAARGDRGVLAAALHGADVVRQGKTERLLPAAAWDARVPHLVEWNVFDHHDHSEDEASFACHLFISKMIAAGSGRGGDRGRKPNEAQARPRSAAVDLGLPELRRARDALRADLPPRRARKLGRRLPRRRRR